MGMYKIVEQMGKLIQGTLEDCNFSKMIVHDMELKALQTSTYSTTHYGYKSNIAQTPWTIISHPPHVTTPN